MEDDDIMGGKKSERAGPVHYLHGGLPVFKEDATGTDQYCRFRISCPLDGKGHVQCSRRRNCGPQQTRTYGEVEPLAFLGVWAKKASDGDARRRL